MIAIASDHGGYMLKEHIKAYLAAKGITCEDFGTNSTESCDYPDFARPAAQAVATLTSPAVLVVLSGTVGWFLFYPGLRRKGEDGK